MVEGWVCDPYSAPLLKRQRSAGASSCRRAGRSILTNWDTTDIDYRSGPSLRSEAFRPHFLAGGFFGKSGVGAACSEQPRSGQIICSPFEAFVSVAVRGTVLFTFTISIGGGCVFPSMIMPLMIFGGRTGFWVSVTAPRGSGLFADAGVAVCSGARTTGFSIFCTAV